MIKRTHTHIHTSKDKQLFFYSKQLFSFACLFVSIVLSLSLSFFNHISPNTSIPKKKPEMKAQESMLIFNYG